MINYYTTHIRFLNQIALDVPPACCAVLSMSVATTYNLSNMVAPFIPNES